MTLMNTYRRKQAMEAVRKISDKEIERINAECREKMDRYIEHMDLVILLVLHDDFGFGAARLRKYYNLIQTKYDEYKKYLSDTIDKSTASLYQKDEKGEYILRDDTYRMKQDLKEIGFDYDTVVSENQNI